MDFYERQSEIDKGEHDKLKAPERSVEPEPEYVKCDGCGRDMEHHDHYINGGLCYLCISRIGKD